tara:strand:- start:159 stop:638 length:480 start_codon:yes stop_codon:yes gene_type:complete
MEIPKVNIKAKDLALYGGVALGLFVLAKKFGVFSKKPSAVIRKDQQKELEEDIKKQERKSSPSYSDSQFNDFADKIYNAMFCSIFICADGTDEKAIYAVLRRLNNNLDWLKLKEAFGFRRIEFTTRNAGLVESLNADLSSRQINEVNKILQQQGISYKV